MNKANVVFLFFLFLIIFPQLVLSQEFWPAENYGGKQQLKEFIREEIYYPEKAREDNTEGTVVVSFRVNADGTVNNIKISETVSPELDKEAKRIIKMLLWKPAEMRTKKVPEDKMLEIKFNLKKYKRLKKSRGYDNTDFPFTPIDTSFKIYKVRQTDKSPKPDFRGKATNFTDFLLKNLVYPEAAIHQNISGMVEMFFVVEPSGRVSNVKIEKNVGAGCDQEALRLIKLIRWKPGIKDGRAVRTSMKLSITFNLSDYENNRYVPANNQNTI